MKNLRQKFSTRLVAFFASFTIAIFTFACCCFSTKVHAAEPNSQATFLKNNTAKSCQHCPTSKGEKSDRSCCQKMMPASIEVKPLATNSVDLSQIVYNSVLIKLSAQLTTQHVYLRVHSPPYPSLALSMSTILRI